MLPLSHPRFWLATGILLVIVIVSGSLAPSEDVEGLMLGNDKITHALAYTGLTLWFAGMYPRSRYAWIASGLFMLGAIIEVLQGAMPLGRQSDLRDLVANTTGIGIGLMVAWKWFGGWAQWVEARFRQILTS